MPRPYRYAAPVSVLAAVPVKRFFVAKRRLSPILDRAARSRLGRDLASHTLGAISSAGPEVVVLAADAAVARWASGEGFASHLDPGGGLDAAATALAERATAESRPWLVVHADLPLLTPEDVTAALAVLEAGRAPLAPTDDGGTSLIGGWGAFGFRYGPSSFHRHLRRATRPHPLVRVGLALDLDDPGDYMAAVHHPRGAWLGRYPARA